MMDFFKKYVYVLIIIFAGLILYKLFLNNNGLFSNFFMNKATKQRIENYEKEIITLKEKNKTSDSIISIYKNNIDTLNDKIITLDSGYNKLKLEYDSLIIEYKIAESNDKKIEEKYENDIQDINNNSNDIRYQLHILSKHFGWED